MKQYDSKLIKCRGIIFYDEKLLVVKHSEKHDFYALPGGHLEGEENPKECTEREIFEEFGIKPQVDRLLYISQYKYMKNDSYLEFFFEVKNGQDYLDKEKYGGTHARELFDVLWVSKNDNLKVLPEKMFSDFKNGSILHDEVIFIKD